MQPSGDSNVGSLQHETSGGKAAPVVALPSTCMTMMRQCAKQHRPCLLLPVPSFKPSAMGRNPKKMEVAAAVALMERCAVHSSSRLQEMLTQLTAVQV